MTMSPFKLLCALTFVLTIELSYPMNVRTSQSCPNIEDLKPCSCKRYAYGLNVICSNFNKTSVLEKTFKILKHYRVHTVLLHGLYPNEILPSDIFDGLEIKEIHVEQSNLKFSEPAFRGLDSSLNVLNVGASSTIKSQDKFSLARLTKLDELHVQKVILERIEDKWLNGKIPNVHSIILDYNGIKFVESHAFSSLSMLKKISLADNRIKVVQRSMFPQPAEYLMRLDLSYNEIDTLPEDFFSGMPALKEVILTQNELTTLPETTWRPVWSNLDQVYLTDNKIDCGEQTVWIKTHRPYDLKGVCFSPKEMAGKDINFIYKRT